MIDRNGHLEEAFFSWSIIPTVGFDGTIKALYNPAFEKTRRKLAERRMLTLRQVGEQTALARDVRSFWKYFVEGLEPNTFDTPFVLVYSVTEESDSETSSMHSMSGQPTKMCVLEGKLGIPDEHPAAPSHIEFRNGIEGYGFAFRDAATMDRPLILNIEKGEIPGELMENIDWRGFQDPCRTVAICPIHPQTGGEQVLGFLVIGVNPRRSYDDDYELFLQLLSRQCATSLASVILFEEEVRKGQKAARLAAIDRIKLAEELAIRTQEAHDIEDRLTRMAELSPAGLFIADHEGKINYSNDAWFDISQVKRTADSVEKWIEYVHEDDQDTVRNMWQNLVDTKGSVTAEFRFKAPWTDPAGKESDRWVLFSAHPQTDKANGMEDQLASLFGTITDISQQKWAEGIQKRRVEEAVELKKAQERFIDITSHELRNPLSAILQCADEISNSLSEFQNREARALEEALVNGSIEAAETITLCANHQKRIVDDVLTLSKIDAEMLMITPVDVQPLSIVQSALKMFEAETQTADINLIFEVTPSFRDMGIDWVRLDPSRVLQVLINLTTNAIKFTTSRDKRNITVTVDASRIRPSKVQKPLVEYFPTRHDEDVTHTADWGDGEEVYVHFAVRDTGRGLTTEERKLLFLRFSQASPRTHVQYGGSGLGLFISRELAELQGGEIGVASEAGKGSTFAFYVKARRSSAPLEGTSELPLSITRQGTDKSRRSTSSRGMNRDGAGDSSRSVSTTPTRTMAATATAAIAASADKKPQELHVLIVEDNLINQKVLAQQLRRFGCVVSVANHGLECLETLAASFYWNSSSPMSEALPASFRQSADSSGVPDPASRKDIGVVLMDQEMPQMDGLTCAKRIRELEAQGHLSRHVPIIAVTANARSEQISQLKSAGMDDVVSKPFRVADLLPRIERLGDRLGIWEEIKKRKESASAESKSAS
jgi:signal transduction histidine kinase/DNA-binding response OmpR family regulator